MSGFINKNSGKKMLLPQLLMSLVMVAVQAMMVSQFIYSKKNNVIQHNTLD
jgi:hypothetical protein